MLLERGITLIFLFLSISGLIWRIGRALHGETSWLTVLIATAAFGIYLALEFSHGSLRSKIVSQLLAAAIILATTDAPFMASYATTHHYEILNTELVILTRFGMPSLEIVRLGAQGPAGERLYDDTLILDRDQMQSECWQYKRDVATVKPETNPIWRSALHSAALWCRLGPSRALRRRWIPVKT